MAVAMGIHQTVQMFMFIQGMFNKMVQVMGQVDQTVTHGASGIYQQGSQAADLK